MSACASQDPDEFQVTYVNIKRKRLRVKTPGGTDDAGAHSKSASPPATIFQPVTIKTEVKEEDLGEDPDIANHETQIKTEVKEEDVSEDPEEEILTCMCHKSVLSLLIVTSLSLSLSLSTAGQHHAGTPLDH